MKLYKASHTVFSLKYHIVWITKKRVRGRGYFVTSVNDKTTSAVIKKYIQNQWAQRAQVELFEVK